MRRPHARLAVTHTRPSPATSAPCRARKAPQAADGQRHQRALGLWTPDHRGRRTRRSAFTNFFLRWDWQDARRRSFRQCARLELELRHRAPVARQLSSRTWAARAKGLAQIRRARSRAIRVAPIISRGVAAAVFQPAVRRRLTAAGPAMHPGYPAERLLARAVAMKGAAEAVAAFERRARATTARASAANWPGPMRLRAARRNATQMLEGRPQHAVSRHVSTHDGFQYFGRAREDREALDALDRAWRPEGFDPREFDLTPIRAGCDPIPGACAAPRADRLSLEGFRWQRRSQDQKLTRRGWFVLLGSGCSSPPRESPLKPRARPAVSFRRTEAQGARRT